jgi:uncharacterized protein YndB with AHSA1/START domain
MKAMRANSTSNEIKLTRIYDAPVKAVWDAWADPAQAAHWWGVVDSCKFDFVRRAVSPHRFHFIEETLQAEVISERFLIVSVGPAC